jgi:hypothetical protein
VPDDPMIRQGLQQLINAKAQATAS